MSTSLDKKIGIIGGGQLGKMMILEAKKLGFYVAILDPVANCPAHSIADRHIVASFDDAAAFNLLASETDVLTYEFEHINAAALTALEEDGYFVYPTAKSLSVIQNKLTQKQRLLDGGVDCPAFCAVNALDDLVQIGERFGYPFILKTCTGGYDGKGNYVIHAPLEHAKGWEALGAGSVALMAEQYIPFLMEISVLACRGIDANTVVYPVAQNDHENNILKQTAVPADIPLETAKKAMDTAATVMELFQGVGMFCVELFVTKDGGVLLNEVAPRPHNSGHYTIEACQTSQFMNHIRAITGLPLGSSALLSPVVMQNILCEGGSGTVIIEGLSRALRGCGVQVHLYGKKTAAPMRKMGHITVCADTVPQAKDLASNAHRALHVRGAQASDTL